jgi:hypothetical protein
MKKMLLTKQNAPKFSDYVEQIVKNAPIKIKKGHFLIFILYQGY